MRSVTKRLGRGSAASTKRHPFFNRIRISVGIFQFHSPFDDVGAVLDDLNCYFSHGASLSDKSRIRQVQEPKTMWMTSSHAMNRTRLITNARCGADVAIIVQLVQHGIGDIGPRNTVGPNVTADVWAVTITSFSGSVRQHGRADDHPVNIAVLNQFLLADPVPQIERED